MARRRAVAVAAPSRIPIGFLLKLLLAAVGAVFLSIIVVGAFFAYRIVSLHNDVENVTPLSFLLNNYENVSFTDHAGGSHEGWLLRGLRGAPVIVLCHGYGSNRSELLSLGTVLQENHFNVFLFNFQGPQARESISSLGARQADDLQAAIEKITQQSDVNLHRVGLYGVTTGGFAALLTAEKNSKVRALVVDSIYEKPEQMFDSQLPDGGSSPILRAVAETEFHLFNLGSKSPRLVQDLPKLAGIPKLFISGRDTPLLALSTENLYGLVPDPKKLLVLEHAQTVLMSGAEKKEYESQILDFFLDNLPRRAD